MHWRCWVMGVTMSQITHFGGIKVLAWKSGGVDFWTNIISCLLTSNLFLKRVSLQMSWFSDEDVCQSTAKPRVMMLDVSPVKCWIWWKPKMFSCTPILRQDCKYFGWVTKMFASCYAKSDDVSVSCEPSKSRSSPEHVRYHVSLVCNNSPQTKTRKTIKLI